MHTRNTIQFQNNPVDNNSVIKKKDFIIKSNEKFLIDPKTKTPVLHSETKEKFYNANKVKK